MPTIRDLGIKVIPETFRPLEIGRAACDCSFIADLESPEQARMPFFE